MNKSELFKKAHEIARNTVKLVGDYMVAFKIALKRVYEIIKSETQSMEQRLLNVGATVWENYGKRRIYINHDLIEKVFALYQTCCL